MLNILPQHSIDNPRLAAALTYAARGCPVFPCHGIRDGQCTCGIADCPHPGKHPLTRHGFKDATTDPTQINRWWADDPDANVAIATGAASGLLVLDQDPRHGGHLTLADLEAQHGKLPETAVSFTGGGGAHYVFRYPDAPIRTGAGVLGPGLDIKADGGYIIAPPSRHASGRDYEWEVSSCPDEVLIAALPTWILMLAQPTTGHGLAQVQVNTSSKPELILPKLDLTKETLISPLIREATIGNADQRILSSHLDREWLATLYKDPKIAWQCLGALGISASRTCEKFLCPIHREERPSASVYVDGKRGGLTIWCWHQGRAYTIPEVRAAQVSGEIRWLRKPSTFIWGMRVLLEARVVPPAPVPYRPLPASLPVTAPAAVRQVHAGFILLLQCRWLSELGQPAPFSRGFAGQWCGVSEFHAEKAMHWLHDHGYIVKASDHTKSLERHGETPRITTLYLPAANGLEQRA